MFQLSVGLFEKFISALLNLRSTAPANICFKWLQNIKLFILNYNIFKFIFSSKRLYQFREMLSFVLE